MMDLGPRGRVAIVARHCRHEGKQLGTIHYHLFFGGEATCGRPPALQFCASRAYRTSAHVGEGICAVRHHCEQCLPRGIGARRASTIFRPIKRQIKRGLHRLGSRDSHTPYRNAREVCRSGRISGFAARQLCERNLYCCGCRTGAGPPLAHERIYPPI